MIEELKLIIEAIKDMGGDVKDVVGWWMAYS